jgi:hypothetical protein
MGDSQQIPVSSEPVREAQTVERLLCRLEAIRDRMWRLRAMFAVSLSQDCAIEANHYLNLFKHSRRS